MIRVFLAVELANELRGAVVLVQQEVKQWIEREGRREVRTTWVRPAALHLTIKFLGEIEEQIVQPLREAMRQALAGRHSLSVPLERIGGFPRAQNPRVLWVGPGAGWEGSCDCAEAAVWQRAIDDRCAQFGFPRETHPFSPHLTIARVKAGDRQVGQALAHSGLLDRPVEIGVLALNGVVLMKSELRPEGPLYTKLWEVHVDDEPGPARDR
jgi:2'-5' RNA ligase